MPNASRSFYVFLIACWLSLGLYALAAQAATQPPLEAPPSTTLAAAPYLRTVLPPDALAYVRLAYPWGLLGVPKGNMLSEALASDGVQAAMRAIQGAIVQQFLGPLQPQVGPLPGVLLAQVRAHKQPFLDTLKELTAIESGSLPIASLQRSADEARPPRANPHRRGQPTDREDQEGESRGSSRASVLCWL